MKKMNKTKCTKARAPEGGADHRADTGLQQNDWDLEPLIRHYVSQQLRSRIPSRDLQDVISASVYEALARLDERPSDCPLGLWTKGIARNCSKAYFRRHRETLSDMEMDAIPASSTDPLHLLVQAEFRLELADQLRKLSEEERNTLRQRFVEELTFAQIAERTGESVSTISTRAYRAVGKLRRLSVGDPSYSG